MPTVNKALLPMKAHYFFYNAGTSPVIPFLPIYGKQLGFSSVVIGVVYTFLPIFGMVAKPLAGAVADRFRCQKLLFLLCQVATVVTLFCVYFVPSIPVASTSAVRLSFGQDGRQGVIASIDTSPNNVTMDACAVDRIQNDIRPFNDSLDCSLNCDTSSCREPQRLCACFNLMACPANLSLLLETKTASEGIKTRPNGQLLLLPYHISPQPRSPGDCYNSDIDCSMDCSNSPSVNTLIRGSQHANDQVMRTHQFWLFFASLVLAWVAQAVVVSVGDTICFQMLGSKPHNYGNQRLWGSVGWGVVSLMAGWMVDQFSEGDINKDFTSAFVLMLVLITLDFGVSTQIKFKQQHMTSHLMRDMGRLLVQPRILVFAVWCACVGMCTGLVWQFLFWHLEQLAERHGCGMQANMKTLEGAVMAVQCLVGELPFFFLSGSILKRIGHVHAMSFVLLACGVRFMLYSVLDNPWWTLPIELLNGPTFSLLYATMASYASIVAPPGAETTTQGLVGAIFEGVGVSLGSLTGGILFDKYQGSGMYRICGIAAFAACFIHFALHYLMQRRRSSADYEMAHRSANEAKNVRTAPNNDNIAEMEPVKC